MLVLAGSVLPGRRIEVSPETMVRQWLTITGVHNYEPRHLTRAVKFLERTLEAYPWRTVVADPVELDAIASALTPAPAGKLRAAIKPVGQVHARVTDRSVHNGVRLEYAPPPQVRRVRRDRGRPR